MNLCKTADFRPELPPPPRGGFYESAFNAKENHADKSLFRHFVLELKGVDDHQDETTIPPKSDSYQQIVIDLINTKSDEKGNFSHTVNFKGAPFLVSQSATDPKKITLVDVTNEAETTIDNIFFVDFKKHLLLQYMKEQRYLGKITTDLSLFDLTGLDVSDVLFTHTIINRRSFEAIHHCGGNLAGATLAKGEHVDDLNLKGVPIDKTMANSLIAAGANFKSVVTSYLATAPGIFSHHYKTTLLIQYIEEERQQQRVPVDLSEFDLGNVSLKLISFKNTLLSHTSAEAIRRSGGNLTGALVIKANSPVDINHKKNIQANFAHDVLTLLTTYSQTVASILLRSTSRDYETKVSSKIYDRHRIVMKHVQKHGWADPKRLHSAIKSSTGNCGEMALMCKNMMDLYLTESLKQLGYNDVSHTSAFCYALPPSSHGVVMLECSFQGQLKKYLIDPWSNGKAWTYDEAMLYFGTVQPGEFIQPDITFTRYDEINNTAEQEPYKSSIQRHFDLLGVKKQLDFMLEKNKAQFINPLVD